MKDLGDMTLYKGKLGDVQLIMWDALPNCSDACNIYDRCPYEGTNNRVKCEMRRRYLESVMKSLEKGIKEKDEISSITMGLLIAPLFQHLISFKIYEHSLQHTVTIKNKINPIYKEIRATIKEINSLLKDLGLTKGDTKRTFLDGNADYYDDMVRRGQIVNGKT